MKKYTNIILNKYRGKFNKREKFNLSFIILSIVLTLVVSNWFFSQTVEDLEEQRSYELIQSSKHAAFHFRQFLDQKLEWMSMFAFSSSLSENTDEEWWQFLKENELEKSRIGITDSKGMLYYGDHQKKDVHEKEYFKEAIRGKNYISPLNLREMNSRNSIILSVPIKNKEKNIVGTVVMEYTILALGENIQNYYDNDWTQYGSNMIIDAEGRLVAPPKGMENYESIYDFLEIMEYKQNDSLDEMKRNVKNEKSGIFLYYHNGERRRVHYMPLDYNGWTVVSIGAMKKYLVILEKIEQRNWIILVVYITILLLDIVAASDIVRSKMERINKLKRDLLTGVYRRREGEKLIDSIFHEKREHKIWGCLFIDVDNFKKINDTMGHETGDEVLSALGEVMKSSVRSQDIIYRYGGDEFVIWLIGNGGRKELIEAGQRIQSGMYKRCQINLSIGGTMVSETEHSFEDVIMRADASVYEAKNRGKNEIVLYENMTH